MRFNASGRSTPFGGTAVLPVTGGREFPANRLNLSPHHATAAFLMTDVAQGTIPVRPIIPPHIWLTKGIESLNGLVVVRTSSGDGATQKSNWFPERVGEMPLRVDRSKSAASECAVRGSSFPARKDTMTTGT